MPEDADRSRPCDPGPGRRATPAERRWPFSRWRPEQAIRRRNQAAREEQDFILKFSTQLRTGLNLRTLLRSLEHRPLQLKFIW